MLVNSRMLGLLNAKVLSATMIDGEILYLRLKLGHDLTIELHEKITSQSMEIFESLRVCTLNNHQLILKSNKGTDINVAFESELGDEKEFFHAIRHQPESYVIVNEMIGDANA